MKKRLFIFIYISFAFLFLIRVNAAECTNEEKAKLKKEAAKVKMIYEEASEVAYKGPIPELGEGDYEISVDYFKIILSNITQNVYVIISSDQDEETIYAGYYALKDGVFSFDVKNINNIIKWRYDVYASNTSCKGESLFTGHLVTPKLNPIYNTDRCAGMSKLSACDKYLKEDVSEEGLIEEVENYQNKQEQKKAEANQPWYKKVLSKINEHKILVVGVLVIATGTGVVLVIRNKKRRTI